MTGRIRCGQCGEREAAGHEARQPGNRPINADLLAPALFSTKPNAATRALKQLGMEPSLMYNKRRKNPSAGASPA